MKRRSLIPIIVLASLVISLVLGVAFNRHAAAVLAPISAGALAITLSSRTLASWGASAVVSEYRNLRLLALVVCGLHLVVQLLVLVVRGAS